MANSFALIAAFTVSSTAIANSLMIAAVQHSKETADLFSWKVLMCWHCCSFLTIKSRLLDYSCLINETISTWFYCRRWCVQVLQILNLFSLSLFDVNSKMILLCLTEGSLRRRVLWEKRLRLIWFLLLLLNMLCTWSWVSSLSICIS